MASCSMRGRWHPLPIIATLIGFLIWWPVGLAILAFMIWGSGRSKDRLRDGFERAKDRARDEFAGMSREFGFANASWKPSGNAAFDEYRRETLRRLEEERRRLEEEGRAFAEFMANLRRARDKEEFDRFMAERARRDNGEGPHGYSV